jgi:putative membrane protein
MVGLLYLPRIFVYHVVNHEKKEATEIFKIMEKKLYFYIMFPAMILSWVFGLILISLINFSSLAFLWLQLKLILVLLLSFYHFYLGSCLKDLRIDKNTKSSKFFRIINEIPTILLVIIIFIVIYKPL